MRSPRFLQIRIAGLSIYVFCAFLMYLAGSYFGGVLLFFFYCLLFFPLVSIVLLAVGIAGLRYIQLFNTDHPVKGETIEYTVKVSNESIAPIFEVAGIFVRVNPLATLSMPDFRFRLGAKKHREVSYRIACRYRGIYNVGLQSILVTDITGFVTIRLAVWHRTFYVYPKIVKIDNLSLTSESFTNRGTAPALFGNADHTLVNSIREYRRNESLRHIYWKKFASGGIPVLKEFDSSASPGLTVYLDTFNGNPENKSVIELEREDLSVEILAALVKYYLDKSVEITVRAPCAPVFDFKGNNPEVFDLFYEQTINLFFGRYPSPVELYKIDLRNGLIGSKTVVFITHRLDPPIFNLLDESIRADTGVIVIFNNAVATSEERAENRNFFNLLRDKGCTIIEVESGETISSDLEKGTHAGIY